MQKHSRLRRIQRVKLPAQVQVLVRPVRGSLAGLLLWFAALFFLTGCEGAVEDVLEKAGGRPQAGQTIGGETPQNAPVPSGPHLYCLTNIGHTLVAFSLTEPGVLSETRRVVELDPVGPWFAEGRGYYLSRVASGGAGSNALIAFDPETLAELGRLQFPGNSNPTTLVVPPGSPAGGAVAYVALLGSTFDNFATNGIAVVDLATLTQTAFLDLNDPALWPTGELLTSLVGLTHDAACGLEGGCIYAVVNNWRFEVRQGRLLVLEPQTGGPPVLRDTIPLGDNPQRATLLDAQGELWVVNNGGYADFDGGPGTLQVLDTGAFADGIPDNETAALLEIGGDPTGIFVFDPTTAWVTTYPDEQIASVDLEQNRLLEDGGALPVLTGPLLPTENPEPGLFAGTGGFGGAGLALLHPATGEVAREFSLEAGNGPVSCAEFVRP